MHSNHEMAGEKEKMASLQDIERTVLNCIQSPIFTRKIMEAVKPVLQEFYQDIKTNTTNIRHTNEKVNKLEMQLKQQQTQVQDLQKQLQNKKKQDRLLTLRITGLSKEENTALDELTELAKDRMAFNLNFHHETTAKTFIINTPVKGKGNPNHQKEAAENDDVIDGGNPQGTPNKKETPQQQKHLTIVTFKNVWHRRQFYQGRLMLKDTGIFINEDLDTEERSLFYKCRMLKKSKKIKNTWTKDLQIYCRLHNNNIIEINSDLDLDKIQPSNSTTTIYGSAKSSQQSFHGFTELEAKEAEQKFERLFPQEPLNTIY